MGHKPRNFKVELTGKLSFIDSQYQKRLYRRLKNKSHQKEHMDRPRKGNAKELLGKLESGVVEE